ncbi:hypothetical protein ASF11_00900 [Acidovorax sp. Leaf76]|nr:hypothetical protein ASF11_00900 [Acidovorax sp. Leaf76]KQO35900.1 hypothetical protein ASF19_22705 [Acidovorax sp. Leaf84]KQS38325.1 hypothetical protein ASG27_23405 [Acidovorax sp. Leaf191]
MILPGLVLGLAGTDGNSGTARYSFSVPELTDGLHFVALAMGVFGFTEIAANVEQCEHCETFGRKPARGPAALARRDQSPCLSPHN